MKTESCFDFLKPLLVGWTVVKVAEDKEEREGGLVLHLGKGTERRIVTLGFNDLGMWPVKILRRHGRVHTWLNVVQMLDNMCDHLISRKNLKTHNLDYYKSKLPFECLDDVTSLVFGFKCTLCKKAEWWVSLNTVKASDPKLVKMFSTPALRKKLVTDERVFNSFLSHQIYI
jgi:hypothetical protein